MSASKTLKRFRIRLECDEPCVWKQTPVKRDGGTEIGAHIEDQRIVTSDVRAQEGSFARRSAE